MPYSANYKLYGPAMIIILFYLLFFISLIVFIPYKVFLCLHRMFRVFVIECRGLSDRLGIELLTQLSSYKGMTITPIELQFNRLFLLTEKLDQLNMLQRDGWNGNTETKLFTGNQFFLYEIFLQLLGQV